MGRYLWSPLFLLVPVLGVAIFAFAALDLWPFQGHWLPRDISQHGRVIDNLFLFILGLTGVIFVATSLALFWFIWKYDAEKNTEPVKYMHGSHTLEVVWSIIPAAVLLFIAIYQMNAWADAKMRRPLDPGPDGVLGTADDPKLPGPDGMLGTADDIPQVKPPLAEIVGRQFEWRIRYAGADGILDTEDDLLHDSDLHVPLGEEVVLRITSEDVLHSFFLPNLRVKQDVIPGMQQFVWFKAMETGKYDIVCAELCGWGHYKMKGRITVEPRAQFDAWLAARYAEQEATQFTPPETGE